jgi:Na+-driven multidrug efflux pump
MLVNVGVLWLIQLPACWLLSTALGLGPIGVWLGIALGNVSGALIITRTLARGRWKSLTL